VGVAKQVVAQFGIFGLCLEGLLKHYVLCATRNFWWVGKFEWFETFCNLKKKTPHHINALVGQLIIQEDDFFDQVVSNDDVISFLP
jgi:hypothetical protein